MIGVPFVVIFCIIMVSVMMGLVVFLVLTDPDIMEVEYDEQDVWFQ